MTAPYIAAVVLLAIGGVVLISQRAQIARLGQATAAARGEAGTVEAAVCRLKVRVARSKSAQGLVSLAERFELDLVPPETADAHDPPRDRSRP